MVGCKRGKLLDIYCMDLCENFGLILIGSGIKIF